MRLSTHLFHHPPMESNVTPEKKLDKTQSKLSSFWYKIWQSILTVAFTKNELQVWQKSHPDGNTEWHAYDPTTGRSICVASDAEMRIWIEQQYYQ